MSAAGVVKSDSPRPHRPDHSAQSTHSAHSALRPSLPFRPLRRTAPHRTAPGSAYRPSAAGIDSSNITYMSGIPSQQPRSIERVRTLLPRIWPGQVNSHTIFSITSSTPCFFSSSPVRSEFCYARNVVQICSIIFFSIPFCFASASPVGGYMCPQPPCLTRPEADRSISPGPVVPTGLSGQ